MRQIAWRMFLEVFSLEDVWKAGSSPIFENYSLENFRNVGSNPIFKEFEKYFNVFLTF